MSEQNALALLQGAAKGIAKRVDDQTVASVLAAGDYLPYITITTGQSELVKEGKVEMGVVAVVVNQNPISLGKEPVMVVLAERTKAMRFGDNVLSYYNPTSPEFKKVMEDSNIPNSQAMAGMEFLVWIPSVGGPNGMFAGLFCASKSLKKEAATIRGFVDPPTQMVLKVYLAKNNKGSWHTASAAKSTAPIGNAPQPEELKKQLERFCNPVESTVEKAAAPAAAGRAR